MQGGSRGCGRYGRQRGVGGRRSVGRGVGGRSDAGKSEGQKGGSNEGSTQTGQQQLVPLIQQIQCDTDDTSFIRVGQLARHFPQRDPRGIFCLLVRIAFNGDVT